MHISNKSSNFAPKFKKTTQNNNSKTFRIMKIYSVKMSDGTTKDVYSLQSVKRIFKEDLGATAFGWKIYSNGDTVALGEVSRKGSNAVKLSNQTTYNYQ